jgi:hypothetical protein
MTTLDVHGMVTKYKINRPLSKDDELGHMPVSQPQNQPPHYQRSVIKLNSTFVESVDKFYALRGWPAMGGALISTLLIFLLSLGLYTAFTSTQPFYFPALFIFLGACIFLYIALRILFSDIFTYTHYPIRFNRKSRQVYVWRRNGAVLKVNWDDLYCTLPVDSNSMKDQYVACYVLAEDKKTVKETFALSMSTAGLDGERNLRGLFEFYRRYMQSGPEKMIDCIKYEDGTPEKFYCLPPIDKQRETLLFGWRIINAMMNGRLILQILFQWAFIPMSMFRWLAMRTSKIPQWPQWVEDECQIEKDDPWLRDYYNNPEPKPW